MSNAFRNSKVIKASLIILAMVALGAVIVIGRDFIYPVCMAILFAYLVYPLAKLLEKYIKFRILATLISVVIALIVIAGAIFFLYQQFSFFLDDFPQLRANASKNIKLLEQKLDNIPILFEGNKSLDTIIVDMLGAQQNMMKQVLDATTATLLGLGLQPVYVYFMLYYRHHFREFLFEITSTPQHKKLENVLREIAHVTKNYVSGVFIVVFILCFLNSFGLMIIGIDYAVMFGIISAIMNFIPYFGTLIGGFIPLCYTLVSSEPQNAVGVIILFVIIQFTENNILTPNITGGRVAINPLFTIFSIIIGGMAWGIPGMFIFVPFMGMFKVVCEHVGPLKPLAKLMSPKNPDKKNPIIEWFKRVRK